MGQCTQFMLAGLSQPAKQRAVHREEWVQKVHRLRLWPIRYCSQMKEAQTQFLPPGNMAATAFIATGVGNVRPNVQCVTPDVVVIVP